MSAMPNFIPAVHFVGFRDDRYWNAVRIWGRPHFIHRGWDIRARWETADGDTVIFAKGTADDPPNVRNFHDIDEAPRE